MDEEVNKLFNQLDIKIDMLSERLEQYINQTNNEISQLKQQEKTKILISEKTSLPSKVKNPTSSKNNNSNPALARKKVKNEYLIDYSYIDIEKYPELKDDLDTLNKYSKKMAECREYNQDLPIFCRYGRNTLERAVKMFFKYEYQYLSHDNTVFLAAYNRVKEYYTKRNSKNNNWKLPNIYVKNAIIQSSVFKQIDSQCISWKEIENIQKSSLPASIRIFCEIIKPDFINEHRLKNYFNTLISANQIRNRLSNSHDIDKDEINLFRETQEILKHKSFDKVQEAIEWFVQEVYKRIEKII